MQPTRRPKFKPKEPTIKLGDLEDDTDQNFDIEERPPCRQNPNLFDLDDNFHPVPSN